METDTELQDRHDAEGVCAVTAEPIQSRCAVLRYTKLRDEQIMMRLMEVVEKETLSTTNDGLEAIIFTAQGDMRQVRRYLLKRKTHCIQ